jgi:hypothetical protein
MTKYKTIKLGEAQIGDWVGILGRQFRIEEILPDGKIKLWCIDDDGTPKLDPNFEVSLLSRSLKNQITELKKALELVLLFYHPGSWTEEKRAQWNSITDQDCTTRGMCDHIRDVLKEIEKNDR